jgi:hypothetical protein
MVSAPNPASLDFYFLPRTFVREALEGAGLVLDSWTERSP